MQFISKVKFDKKISLSENKSCTGYYLETGNLIDYKQNDFNKLVNIKIPKVGNIHISGAKKDVHIFKAFEFIIKYMNNIDNIYSIIKGSRIKGIVNRIMTNAKANCNFMIKREKLNSYISDIIPSCYSFFEPSLRYPGVKITLNVNMPSNTKSIQITMNREGSYKIKNIPYIDYISYVKKIDNKKKIKPFDTKNIEFMVFKKGVVIITCPYQEMIPKLLDFFLRCLHENRSLVEY